MHLSSVWYGCKNVIHENKLLDIAQTCGIDIWLSLKISYIVSRPGAYLRKIAPIACTKIAFYIYYLLIISPGIHVYVYYMSFAKLLKKKFKETKYYLAITTCSVWYWNQRTVHDNKLSVICWYQWLIHDSKLPYIWTLWYRFIMVFMTISYLTYLKHVA